jgi:hypothetical protein
MSKEVITALTRRTLLGVLALWPWPAVRRPKHGKKAAPMQLV